MRFTEEHLSEFDNLFFTKEERETGFVSANLVDADTYNTMMWAYYEGDAAICYKGYPDEEKYLIFFREYLTARNIDFTITHQSSDDCYHLEFH